MTTDEAYQCDIEPHGSGHWDVYIYEVHGRGGLDQDIVLSEWKRDRWSNHRRYVGRRRSSRSAQRLARRALRKVQAKQAARDRRQARWTSNRARPKFTVTETEEDS